MALHKAGRIDHAFQSMAVRGVTPASRGLRSFPDPLKIVLEVV
jgi:hypothetical protein